MSFFKTGRYGALACLFVSACGGSETTPQDQGEKLVEKPVVAAVTDTDDAPAAQATGKGSVEAGTILATEFASLPEPYRSADYSRGRRTFKLCQSCHTLAEGGSNLVGPNLYGVFGREIGSVEGFRYSRAVDDSEIIWTPEDLDRWLADPRGFLPGNNMSFAGVRRPDDRLAVIAYIMVETGWNEEAAE